MNGHPFASLIHLRPRSNVSYISLGRTVLITDPVGRIRNPRKHGFFFHETRMLSRYLYTLRGHKLMAVTYSNAAESTWLGYFIAYPVPVHKNLFGSGSGQMKPITEYSLELVISRAVNEHISETVTLTNYTTRPVSLVLELEVDADFADIEEMSEERKQHGELKRDWETGPSTGTLRLSYKARPENGSYKRYVYPVDRAVELHSQGVGEAPAWDGERITFSVHLSPRESVKIKNELIPVLKDAGSESLPKNISYPSSDVLPPRSFVEKFTEEATRFSTGEDPFAHVVTGVIERAKRDIATLRLGDLDSGAHGWTIAAGYPLYSAFYGRDVLTASWQAALLGTELMQGTLRTVGQLQGTALDSRRDEEPGKMLHEAHTGPLKTLGYNPRWRSYSSITTSAFYPVVVAELWHWTADRDAVGSCLNATIKTLHWLDNGGDLDGDGFYEYKRMSKEGVRNQAWKDSPDAIVYTDGSLVKPPIATCEEQGFVYLAKLHFAEVLWWFGQKEEAKRLFREAGELKKRFNDKFWMEDEGFYALGLDPQKKHIRSIASNPGHCLATGITDESLVERTANRLMADDLFSGWGVRTLSSRHAAFNPYSYHRGSVWPVEQGTFALGFIRYGLHSHLDKLCRAMFEAAALFSSLQLPEAFSGHARSAEQPFPALYPYANSPQAWSASSVLTMVQALLGLYPYAPLHLLIVDPHLPEWLPQFTISNLRVAGAKVTIRFFRKRNGKSSYRVLDLKGKLHVVRYPSPWSLTATFGEKVFDLLQSLLPGK